VIKPAQFACSITPRSARVAEMIRAEAAVQDASLRVEDASQYEDRLLTVLEQQQRSKGRPVGTVAAQY
jgi:hypothetical protein